MPDKKKKICMIVPEKTVKGGIASVVSRYYESELTEKYEITFLTSYRDGIKWQKLVKGISCYRAFAKLLRRNPPDLLHIHSSFGPSFYRKLPLIRMAKKRGIPVVNHLHGSDLDGLYYHCGKRKQELVRKTYESCDRLVLLSNHWKEEMKKIAPRAKAEIVPNYGTFFPAMLDDDIQEAREKNKQVLFLGMIVPGKGADVFPAVIQNVLREVKEASFVFGGIGETKELLQALPEAARERVSCPGWITGEEKEKAFRESAVFFFPSRMEAFPMAVLEAMGHGLPIVATKTGGIPDIVEDGKDGFLAEVGDEKTMSEKIIRLLTREDERRACGENSLHRIEEAFSFEEHIRKLEKIYEEILG